MFGVRRLSHHLANGIDSRHRIQKKGTSVITPHHAHKLCIQGPLLLRRCVGSSSANQKTPLPWCLAPIMANIKLIVNQHCCCVPAAVPNRSVHPTDTWILLCRASLLGGIRLLRVICHMKVIWRPKAVQIQSISPRHSQLLLRFLQPLHPPRKLRVLLLQDGTHCSRQAQFGPEKGQARDLAKGSSKGWQDSPCKRMTGPLQQDPKSETLQKGVKTEPLPQDGNNNQRTVQNLWEKALKQ